MASGACFPLPWGRGGYGLFESAHTRPNRPLVIGPLGSQKTRSRVNWGRFGRSRRTGRFECNKAPRGPWARPMGPRCPSCACSLCAGGPSGFLVVYAGARALKPASYSACLCVYVQLHSIMGLRRILQDLRRRSHRSYNRRRPRPRPRRCYRRPRIRPRFFNPQHWLLCHLGLY